MRDTYLCCRIYSDQLSMAGTGQQLLFLKHSNQDDLGRCSSDLILVFEIVPGLIFSFIIIMLLIDSFLLLLIVGGLHFIKYKFPNFLFFCKGAVLFLPPDEQTQSSQKKQKKNEEKAQVQIKIIQVEYNHVKQYPKKDQYERVVFMIVGLALYIPIKWLINLIVDYITGQTGFISPSSFTFIICFVLFIYAIKLGLQIFWISSYNLKYCLLVAIGINILFFFIYLTASANNGVDKELEWSIIQFQKQLEIVFGRQITKEGISLKLIFFIMLVINILLTIVNIPAVIKFGNWYTKTLKQVYYEDEETPKIKNEEERKQRMKQQVQLKQKCKSAIRLLNLYLVAVLFFLFFSHSYSHQFIDPRIVDFIRFILLGLIAFVNSYTLKDAIQFNGSFAYKFITDYANSENQQQKRTLRRKIIPYLYLIWYHKFQLMFRVIFPLIIFFMLMDWKYMQPQPALSSQPIISYTHCGVQTNQLEIIENLYKCDNTSATNHLHKISEPFINGLLIAGKRIDDLSETKMKIAQYGLLNSYFMVQFMESLLWYTNLAVYGMTLVYILFLRKTVYDI